MNEPKLHLFGLRPLPIDGRDFIFGSIFNLGDVSDLPPEFTVATPLVIKDQATTDYCSCFAGTEVSEDQTEIVLDPLWQFMKAKVEDGSPDTFGCDLRSAAKSFIDYGSIPESESPYTIQTPREIIVAPSSWVDKDYDTIALPYKKQSFAFITPITTDLFDAIRLAMWHGNRQSVELGVDWCHEWSSITTGIIDAIGTYPTGHAIKIFGWKQINGQPYLIAQLSNGTSFGDNGLFYFERDVINAQQAYGAFTFTPYSPEAIAYHVTNGMKIDSNIFMKAFQFLINLFHL